MTKSKRVMRRLILSRLYEYLQDQYGIFYTRESFMNRELSLHELDGLLAFKSDPQLDELRHALDRIEDGTYGICISCKSFIDQDVLNSDPAQRICTACEHKFIQVPTQEYAQHHAIA